MIDTVISLPTVLPAIPRERSARARRSRLGRRLYSTGPGTRVRARLGRRHVCRKLDTGAMKPLTKEHSKFLEFVV